MRMKDIEVGGEYAWARGDRDRRHRVKVLQTGLPEHTGYKPQMNRVEVEFLDDPPFGGWGIKSGSVKKVLSREIRNTWAEQIDLDQRAEEARAARKARNQAARETADAYTALFTELGFEIGWVSGLKVVPDSPEAPKLYIEDDAAQKLFDLLAEKTHA